MKDIKMVTTFNKESATSLLKSSAQLDLCCMIKTRDGKSKPGFVSIKKFNLPRGVEFLVKTPDVTKFMSTAKTAEYMASNCFAI